MEYLKISELKKGYLYFIIARNANYGIYISDRQGFLISRHKFGNNFLFEEYHWDCEAFATTKPLREIEKSPFDYDQIKNAMVMNKYDKEILDYLNKFEYEYKLEKEKGDYCKVCGRIWYNCLCYHEDL